MKEGRLNKEVMKAACRRDWDGSGRRVRMSGNERGVGGSRRRSGVVGSCRQGGRGRKGQVGRGIMQWRKRVEGKGKERGGRNGGWVRREEGWGGRN